MTENLKFGKALHLIRVYHDITQTQLAEGLGISRSFVSNLESDNKSPSLETLAEYAEFFNTPVSQIIRFQEGLQDDTNRLPIANETRWQIGLFLNTIHGEGHCDDAG